MDVSFPSGNMAAKQKHNPTVLLDPPGKFNGLSLSSARPEAPSPLRERAGVRV
jgi:hypothetical protein